MSTKTKVENLKTSHLCIFVDGSVKKVAILGETCNGELIRVTWRERHQPIPGHGSFVDLEEYVSVDHLVPLGGSQNE